MQHKDPLSRLVTQLLLRGALRALVLIFSTTIHVYNCIYYGMVVRPASAVLEVFMRYSSSSFWLWHL